MNSDVLKCQHIRNDLQIKVLRKYVEDWKVWGRKVIFTNGCFDVFHPGHLGLLKFIHEMMSSDARLVVGLNSDASVARLKGPGRPIFGHSERAQAIITTGYVHRVVVFEEDTPERLIRIIKPDVVVKGGDYTVEDVVSCHAKVVIGPYDDRWSTTKIIDRIRGS